MKKLPLLIAGLGLFGLIASTGAAAEKASGPKARLMEKYDLNHNGVIDGDEIVAVRKDFAAAPEGELKRYDANKNGKLDDDEIATMKPPGAAKGKDTEKAKGKAKTTTETAPKETTESKE